MTEQEILEGNKLIAEFMGATIDESNNVKFILPADGIGLAGCGLKACRYHTSWDWLMPVVQKIGKQMDRTILGILKHFNETQSNFWCDGIENIWEGCVQFIKWYNQTPKL
jgi:hypothetical protein